MTLIVTFNGLESIWLLADRRLSYKGRAPKDDARKVMILETNDGLAILGYAGLGATSLGTEPADWMSSVLRGRNLPLEQSLLVLEEAMKKQMPRHMRSMPGLGVPHHNVLVTAFLRDEVRSYTISLAFTPDRRAFTTTCVRRLSPPPLSRTPRICIGGSGALYLLPKPRPWIRPLLRLMSAYERGRVSALTVANGLAKLNYQVHQNTADQSVGPSCIVAWRNRKSGFHKGGGGHQFFTEEALDANSPILPVIACGYDLNSLVTAMRPATNRMLEDFRAGRPLRQIDGDEINAELARLPHNPDENLR